MSRKIVIISGANRGLGKSLVNLLLREPETIVVSLSRSLSDDQKELTGSDSFKFIKLDLNEYHDYFQLAELNNYISLTDKIVFISNAGIIHPIKRVGDLSPDEINTIFNVNAKSPVIICNYFLKNFSTNSIDFVNISSGAATRSIANWSLYCSTKMFAKSFFETIALENLENNKIRVFNLDPGAMDTSMQDEIRKNTFPEKQYFDDLKIEGKLKTVFEAASDILRKIR